VVDWVFDTTSVHWLRKAVRLHSDLDIDWVAVAMVIDLLRRNEELERRNQCFEQQLKRFLES
jgi:chaperone modulatory protein CbpM